MRAQLHFPALHLALVVSEAYGDGEMGMVEVGEEGDIYTYRYTITTRMTSALRWAAMRAILMFQ